MLLEDDVGLDADFDNIHLTKRFRNAVVAGNIIISDVPLHPSCLEALGRHVGITVQDVIERGQRDRQKFHVVYQFMEKMQALGAALAVHEGLPQQLRTAAHDVRLLGSLLHIWFEAMFNLHLDLVDAAMKYVTFHLLVFFLQKERNSFNKVHAFAWGCVGIFGWF